MKTIYYLPILIIVLIGCQQEELFSNRDIRFAIPIPADDTWADTDVDLKNLSLQLTLSDAQGNRVVSDQKISISEQGDRYTSSAVNLPEGNYTITDFLVKNQNDQVIYALPRKGSTLVSTTCNHNVEVTRNNPDDIRVEVLSVNGRTSQDFGYAPGAFKTYSIKVTVSIRKDNALKLTNATAYIQSDDGENYLYQLEPKVNTLNFDGDPNKTYKLLVWKDGYQVYSQEFVYNIHRKEKHGKPIEVVLEEEHSQPGLEVMIQPSADYFSMWIEVSEEGMIVLDWGNGETESLMFNVDPENMTATGYFYRDHEYAGERPAIKLRGDIHLITGLFFDGAISDLHVEHCPAIKGLIFTDAHFSTLNLSTNTALEYFSFFNSSIENFILPQQHAIRSIHIETDGTWPNTEQLDYVVENIHSNVVAGNFSSGTFTLVANSISDEAITLLAELRESYGWQVSF